MALNGLAITNHKNDMAIVVNVITESSIFGVCFRVFFNVCHRVFFSVIFRVRVRVRVRVCVCV